MELKQLTLHGVQLTFALAAIAPIAAIFLPLNPIWFILLFWSFTLAHGVIVWLSFEQSKLKTQIDESFAADLEALKLRTKTLEERNWARSR